MFTWTDQAWAEWERRLEFKYLEGANWITFSSQTYTTNIGGHAWYTFDIRPTFFDRDDFTPPPPGNRWYVVCATPVFKGLYAPGSLGTGLCAPIVWLE